MKKIFIIGNGFDLAHSLPTKYNPDFKSIAEGIEQISYFWDIYQSQVAEIWSDFENCLAFPDFNNLKEIFDGYAPDYFSDYEHDRNAIITQVDLNGNLMRALYLFADQAENEINLKEPLSQFIKSFTSNDLFVNMNYTHTLEMLYGINKDKVLHIHGEVGANNLILGYPEENYQPEKYYYDVRQKGRGPYREVDIEQHIEDMLEDGLFDYYTYTAYAFLIEKTKSFCKYYRIDLLNDFVKDEYIEEIEIIGHSCGVDFPYFEYLNRKYPTAKWIFNPFDDRTKDNVKKMINDIKIINYRIV